MIVEIYFDNLDTFDDIDTSDVDLDNDITDDSSVFYDSFAASEDLELDDYEDFQGFVPEYPIPINDDVVDAPYEHQHEPIKSSQISFGLGCHCMVHGCGCRSFEGKFGCVCTNCHHGYDKHF